MFVIGVFVFQTNIPSHSFFASKQKKQELVDPKEFRNKKSPSVQGYMRKKPRHFTGNPRITNRLPSSSDIEKEIRITQASLRGGLNAAKGVSAVLETMTGKEGKEIQVHNSECEFGKLKFQRRQQDTQATADNDVHLISQTHDVVTPGDASQRTENYPIVNVKRHEGMPDLALNYEKCTTGNPELCVCSKQTHKFQAQNPRVQPHTCGCKHVVSQVKKRQGKLESEDSTACRNTDAKEWKSTSQYCSSSSCHAGVCKCSEQKVHMKACNSALLHLKSSFSPEEIKDPQPGSRLVVQTLPSLTIKRDLSIQKVPSVSIPSPDAPPFVPTQENIALCKMSHSQIQQEPHDTASNTLDHKQGTDKKVSEYEPKLEDRTRKHTDQKHRHYRVSRVLSELVKRDKVAEDSTHHDLLRQTIPATESGTVRSNECERNVLTHEKKGLHSVTGYGRSKDELKLAAATEFSQRKPQSAPHMSLLKQSSPEQHQTLCKTCGNTFLLRDLHYGVCGKCRNTSSPKLEAKYQVRGSTPGAVKAAARLNQCRGCLRHFPESELFQSHCIQCQLEIKEMRLFQCNVCLNSVPGTEYNNGKCNHCHHKFQSDAQKDELDSYPAVEGPPMYRILNTVLDETSLFFDTSKAQGINKSLPIGDNRSVRNKKKSHHLSGADKETRQSYVVEKARAETPCTISNTKPRKNSVRNSKVHFVAEEYVISSDSENKSIKTSVDVFKQSDKKVLKFQEALSEKLESYDDCETRTMIRATDNCRATSYFGEKGREYLSLSFGSRNNEEEGASNDSNELRHVGTKAACDNDNSDGGSSGRNDNTESGSTNSNTESEVTQENKEVSRKPLSVPANVRYRTTKQETQTHARIIAAVQMTEDLPKETSDLAHTDIGKKLHIMDNALHHQLDTSNRRERSLEEVSQCDSKALELQKTDGSSIRTYNNKYDHSLKSLSEVKAGNGAGVKDFDHGIISRSSSDENMQHYKHHHYDNSESLQVSDKHQFCMSVSKSHAATCKTVDCSQNYSYNTMEYHSGTVSNESRRQNTSKHHHHYFDDNDNWRKTEEDIRVKKLQESLRAVTIFKKLSTCKSKSKDDDNEEKHHVVTVSM
jgi:hypothetical protein